MVLGQCSHKVRSRLSGATNWDIVNNRGDVFKLLKQIKEILYTKGRLTKHGGHVLAKVFRNLAKFYQKENMTSQDYKDKFTGLVEVYKLTEA